MPAGVQLLIVKQSLYYLPLMKDIIFYMQIGHLEIVQTYRIFLRCCHVETLTIYYVKNLPQTNLMEVLFYILNPVHVVEPLVKRTEKKEIR